MDVLFFLKKRTRFIRYFYKTAGFPFRETMRNVDKGESPFDNPPYSEDDEPPYIDEYLEASDALEVLGRSCLSMLSLSLRLYFRTWENELGISCGEYNFKRGFLQGYKTCFEKELRLSWAQCPANLGLIEEIILARNRDQHVEIIATMSVDHAIKDLKKHQHPFFVNEIERRIYDDPKMLGNFWMKPTVSVSSQKLYDAIDEVDKLTDWLEGRILAFSVRP